MGFAAGEGAEENSAQIAICFWSISVAVPARQFAQVAAELLLLRRYVHGATKLLAAEVGCSGVGR
jgi:hypothetical protein